MRESFSANSRSEARSVSQGISRSLTLTPQDSVSIYHFHGGVFSFGVIDAGIGYEQIADADSGEGLNDGRAWLYWRSHF